ADARELGRVAALARRPRRLPVLRDPARGAPASREVRRRLPRVPAALGPAAATPDFSRSSPRSAAMNRSRLAVLLLITAWLPCPRTPAAQDTPPPAPAEQYQALVKEFFAAGSAGGPTTDEERMKGMKKAYQHRYDLELKFIELAEKYPQDPVAVDALKQGVWL